jgi:hypothetical protein
MLKVDQRKTVIEAIISITGDDEILTTDSQSLSPLHFVAGGVLSKIKLSLRDTGISKRKGNYTEGWILLAPNREATFESVNRRHQSDGVGLTLDIPKLKQASAVRKQSRLDNDFESKFVDLYKTSEWVHEYWFTYDICQLNLVLATVVFDLKDAKVFPFLYKTEGGCGGKPPWNNLDTVVSALHKFAGGKARTGILAIMDEASLIQSNKLKPKDSIYMQANHYAQTGNQALNRMVENKLLFSSMSAGEKLNLLNSCKGENPLPDTLMEKSITIEPENKLIGSAISDLRRNGLVMTELDVRLKLISEEKFFSVLGERNMGEVKTSLDFLRSSSKKNGFKLLSEILPNKNKKEILYENTKKVMNSYFTSRAKRDDITSLSYAGIIRVFKTADVLNEFQTQSYGLGDEILSSLESDLFTNRHLNHAKRVRDFQVDWLENHDLINLINQEVPPGIGPDDARIARKLLSLENENKDIPFLSFVVTNDRAMIESLNAITRNGVIRFPKETYFSEIYDPNPRYRMKKKFLLKHCELNTLMYSSFIEESCKQNGINKYIVLYDFPNLERDIETWQDMSGFKFSNSGGYLKRISIKESGSWSEKPWSHFKQMNDFTVGVKKKNFTKYRN